MKVTNSTALNEQQQLRPFSSQPAARMAGEFTGMSSGAASWKADNKSCMRTCFSYILSPFVFVGGIFASVGRFLQSWVCCCCNYPARNERLDWVKTRDAFAKIYCAVLTNGGRVVSVQKQFTEGYEALSKQAQDEFKKHVAFAIACKKEGKTDRHAQEAWYEEHKTHIDFEQDYFIKVDGCLEILKLAADSFQKEIDRNLK